MNDAQQNTKNAQAAQDDASRTVVGAPQNLVHDALAFYEDSADAADLNEMEAFNRLEAGLNENRGRAEAAAADRAAMVTQPLPQRSEDAVAAPVSERSGAEEETSIEDYMANLLQRVNGGASSARSSPPPAPPKPKAPARSEAPAAAAKPEAGDHREVKPPPESREGLSHMRELANMTARSAIDTHAHRKLAAPLNAKVIVAAGAIAVSSWVSFQASSVMSLEFVGSILALGIAAVYCRQTFKVARQISKPTIHPTSPASPTP